ncbi:hypothetical protein CMO93_04735 [Candidatus Woesearchaeota archaeon]|nr:hypothetical protein [Candidatus Woesearchaeota archaeon]|tara:strand:- start:2311 stop:2823 length:513 start_codon:yes stop_codon:yes gene_type:complete
MKKGIELSLNFLVTIIIALTIFGFGIRFISNLASQATELEGLTIEQLDKRIGELLCESTERVCIGVDKRIIPRGKFDIFGIRIINIQNTKDFDIIIERPDIPGYTKKNEEILSDELDWKPKTRTIRLERNEEKEIGIGVRVPKDARSGTYIFDVRVPQYSSLHKIYVEVP